MFRLHDSEEALFALLVRMICRIRCGSITIVKQDNCVIQLTTVETTYASDSDPNSASPHSATNQIPA